MVKFGKLTLLAAASICSLAAGSVLLWAVVHDVCAGRFRGWREVLAAAFCGGALGAGGVACGVAYGLLLRAAWKDEV